MPNRTVSEVCLHLRSSEVPMRLVGPAHSHPLPRIRIAYWCARTKECFGPDRVVCNAQACQRGRICFEAGMTLKHPELVRLRIPV